MNEGTIQLSSLTTDQTNPGGTSSGAQVYAGSTGTTDYFYWFVGGISGANTGTITKSWAYRPFLNRHITAANSSYVGCLQMVGGIAGYNRGTVSYCWQHGARGSCYQAGGGLVGANASANGKLEYCWTYMDTWTCLESQIGDSVSSNWNSGTVTSVQLWDKYYSTSMGTNNSSLANMVPSGWSTSIWQTSASGPMLKENPIAFSR